MSNIEALLLLFVLASCSLLIFLFPQQKKNWKELRTFGGFSGFFDASVCHEDFLSSLRDGFLDSFDFGDTVNQITSHEIGALAARAPRRSYAVRSMRAGLLSF
jgi:hypothetical protein